MRGKMTAAPYWSDLEKSPCSRKEGKCHESKIMTVASVIAAIAAALCCIGPIVTVELGLGAVGLAAVFESVRPYLLGLTLVILAVAFYRAYRPRPDGSCAAGANVLAVRSNG